LPVVRKGTDQLPDAARANGQKELDDRDANFPTEQSNEAAKE
jgi:hypothetical protein